MSATLGNFCEYYTSNLQSHKSVQRETRTKSLGTTKKWLLYKNLLCSYYIKWRMWQLITFVFSLSTPVLISSSPSVRGVLLLTHIAAQPTEAHNIQCHHLCFEDIGQETWARIPLNLNHLVTKTGILGWQATLCQSSVLNLKWLSIQVCFNYFSILVFVMYGAH